MKAAGKNSMLNPKQSAKHVCRTVTSASSIARSVTFYEMIRQRTRSISSQFLTSYQFRTFTSGRADHTVIGSEEKEGAREHTANQLQKKCRKKRFLNIHNRFIRDTWFRKTIIELDRTEEVIREMDKLANEDHTHHANEKEINVYRSNWWIRSNFVGSDTMPSKASL